MGYLEIDELHRDFLGWFCSDQQDCLLVDCLVEKAIFFFFVLDEVGPVRNRVVLEVDEPLDNAELLLEVLNLQRLHPPYQ